MTCEDCSHIFPQLSWQEASYAQHNPHASNCSLMQMRKVLKLTTVVSNQAHQQCHWFNIWNIYSASGQVCWAMRIIWHLVCPRIMARAGFVLYICQLPCDHMMKNVSWLKNNNKKPQKKIHHPHPHPQYWMGAQWKFTLPDSCLY